ncbi:discoidin domain-containing protein [Actinoplanes oblitus]|uniref:Discoidin domain-containing protein n=1 Tax=Actinoplanes oblitus TaxID=3040509 RepID=A0ABY8WDE5_9ACTN|nr:discoidin domain-containing protein [Actinoplanes oblitus]WIM95073.1 discoidin domain-containing protein [Actinoplanes oblitus]
MANRTAPIATLAAVLAATAVTAVTWSSTPAQAAGLSPFDISGRGATVPFTEIEAEKAATNGTSTGTDRTYGALSSEASGREAVTLDAAGEYVEFTLTKPANAVTFRYSVPDGRSGSLDLRAGSTLIKSVPVTSKYSWYYGYYPFTNNPGDGRPHHFYDEARALFGTTYQAGTKIRIQVSSTAQSPSFTIDLADFENVPGPIGKPAGAIDAVADYGADPTGATDTTARIQAAVDAGAASGRVVYLPQGSYTLYSHVIVDRVTLAGAGPWYTVLGGRHPSQRNQAAGLYGKYVGQGGPSRNVTVKDLAVIGDIQERVDEDQVNAFGGAMSNSTVDDVWMQHTKVGAWMDGPMDNFTIRNSRILDQTADGVNFHIGVTNSTVTNTFVRNTGDDGLAMWAENTANVGNAFTHNTVVAPILANNIVSYGGRDITISDNVMAETVTNGGGLHVANRYPGVTGPTAVAGTWTLARNTLIRTGNSDYNWNFGIGALWFWPDQGAITGATINVTDTDILDSSYAGIQWIGNGTSGLNLTNVNIAGAGTFALQAQAPATATFKNVKATGIAQNPPTYNCTGSGLAITDAGGNSGWQTPTPYCGPWPAPKWGNSTTTPSGPPASSPTPGPSTSSTPPPSNGNLARGKPVTATSSNGNYVAANAVDGNAATYWESANNAFPQTYTVDLGSAQTVGRAVLKLPAGWEKRTETVAVSGSTDGSSWTSLAGAGGVTLDPASGNSATLALTTGNHRYVRLTFSANSGWPAAQLAELEVYASGGTTTPPTSAPPTTTAPPTGNLAAGRTATATSQADVYTPANVTDGNASSYWESGSNAFPQSITVDLGQNRTLGRVVLKLPPTTAWATRTETLSILGSTDGSAYSTVKASAGYTFDPASGNTVTIPVSATQRYLRVTVTGNTGWPAGQLSEIEAYPS